jgi:hypothetical protein
MLRANGLPAAARYRLTWRAPMRQMRAAPSVLEAIVRGYSRGNC